VSDLLNQQEIAWAAKNKFKLMDIFN